MKYKKVREVGRGGTATVFCIREGRGRCLAYKESSNKKLLQLESEILQRTEHPIFPKWHSYWEKEEKAYLVMEYIPGDNLEKYLRRRERISPSQVIRIALELADGIRYLHEQSPPVLYRDLKPANIIVSQEGRVRLVDLGAACFVSEDLNSSLRVFQKAGTPGYAPSEQLEGDGADVRSDIYSLGKVMEYMLNGIKEEKKYRRLKQLIVQCLQENPAKRPPDMRCVMRELSHCLDKGSRPTKDWIYEKSIWKSNYKI